jgi:hypothetical protein
LARGLAARVGLAKRADESGALAFCKVLGLTFEAGWVNQPGCPKSDKYTNGNVRNKATVEPSAVVVALRSLIKKYPSILRALASNVVFEANAIALGAGLKNYGLAFARKMAARRSIE